ncbi:sulfurtransferase TusA family protein [Maribius pontilimi]|uniref:Sulfurtransferase TusA family protein n=1 Tax=Palleronia pontilimi TaxID=1964209 RepID=A0A934MI70_9RHOB|nr:sulfurtransferase TusA family protein [Palleronia pontilimi]MBJ3763984.1 sulfurtransferase TusA family protein [Palleronia pontilimi]
MDYDDDLDARGLLCPLPVLKLRKRLQGVADGAVLRVQADDPAAIVDIPHFCNESGHEFLGLSDADGAQHYFVRKSG